MSSAVFPSDFPGLSWSVLKMASWGTRFQRSISGRELRVADWSNPIWLFTLTFNVLHDKPFGAYTTPTAFRAFLAFFNSRQGAFDTFLFTDPTDHSVTAQEIGVGDASTTVFQLVRQLATGARAENITAPNVVSTIYFNGVAQSPAIYSVDADTGLVTFTSAPAGGVVITVDFTYYFRVRFANDSQEFENFLSQYWRTKQLKLTSVLL